MRKVATREAAVYNNNLKQAFSSVHSVASMHSGVLAACFDLFLDAISINMIQKNTRQNQGKKKKMQLIG